MNVVTNKEDLGSVESSGVVNGCLKLGVTTN
jgi:hypothetical protein